MPPHLNRRATLIACLVLASPLGAVEDLAIGRWGNCLLVTAPGGSIDRGLALRMSQRVTVDFQDTPLVDVADFLRAVTNANIVCAPAITAGSTTLTLRVSDMELGTVLSWVRTLAKVHIGFVDGAIYISDQPAVGASKTVLYDVSDLVLPIRDFPGPELALNVDGKGAGMLAPPVDRDGEQTSSLDELEELIHKHATH
jgi:hypothetical protein